jgi:hypothetical protein
MPLREIQDALLRALTAPDPSEALHRLAADLSLEDRALLSHVDPDGLRLSGKLVAKLRFERLIRSSAELEAAFDRDPAGFAARFREYQNKAPSGAYFPAEELELYKRFLAGG